MKKITAILLTVALLTLFCAPALASINRRGVNIGDVVYVSVKKGKTVNVRNSPNVKGQCDYRMPQNSPVTIIGSGQDNYIEVQFLYKKEFKTGFIDMEYLSMTKPGTVNNSGAESLVEEEAKHTLVKELTFNSYVIPSEPTYVVVTPSRVGGYVNFRWVPSRESAVIAHIYDTNEEFTVITEGKNYYQVMSMDGYVGYIEKKFATKVKHVVDPDPVIK